MRNVVVLALLWQTAVVLGLGAIHAPVNNNNHASTSTLPWVGTEVWSTPNIDNSFPNQVYRTGGELYLYVTGNSTCDERLLTFDMNDGSQTSSASFGDCDLVAFSQQLPFVATSVFDGGGFGLKVFDVNSSSLAPIISFPSLAYRVALFPVGAHFFWFSTDDASTTLIKIDPRARTSTTSKGPGNQEGFVASLNSLFAFSSATNTVYCYSPVTGDVIWTMPVTGSDVVKLVPTPSSDTVLFFFANYSTSLFNSATGAWVWTTANTIASGGGSIVKGASLTVSFAANIAILNVDVLRAQLYETTALDWTSGKILWDTFGGNNKGYPSYGCVLKSNIFITLAITAEPSALNREFSLIGFDVKTGEKVLYYTPFMKVEYTVDSVSCHNDDVYFVTYGKSDAIYTNIQRITFAPRP